MTKEEIIESLKALADPEKVSFKQKKFGVIANNSLGVYHKDLKEIAREIKKSIPKTDVNALAIELFDTYIYEARLLCSKLFNPKDLTFELMEYWTPTFENWEICDSFCMGIYAKSPIPIPKIKEWANRTKEFEKRAAFATMAAYCMADKKAANEVYEAFLPIIKKAATDERIYVKKAVNWALRSIGKRNIDLHESAIETANQIAEMDNKAAKWIAKDALRELEGEKLNILDYPRCIYRP